MWQHPRMETRAAINAALMEYHGDGFKDSDAYKRRLYIISRKVAGSQFLSYHGCSYLIHDAHFVALNAQYRHATTKCVGLSPDDHDASAPLYADNLLWYCCFDIDDVGIDLGYDLIKIAANVSPVTFDVCSLTASCGRKFRML